MRPLEISVASSGMITTGCRPRTPVGQLPAADPQRDEAGEDAADQAAEEAGADGHRHGADDEAGGDARPVGDREGDVAGQRRDEEAERGLAEHGADGAEVAEEPVVEALDARRRSAG